MKAIVQSEYGPADVLRLEELDKPAIADNEVCIKVRGAGVHAGDWHLMRGTPFLIRLMLGGILKPTIKTIGTDIAGVVESIGENVSQVKLGDEVFGDLSGCGFGAFAEYVSVSEQALVLKPSNLTFEEAATVPVSGLAALQALRDCGHIQPGQRVLITGASGGVGSFAVQLAKVFGAEVTGVCSTAKMEMVRSLGGSNGASLGVDHIIDYTQTDPARPEQPYDVIIDTAAYRPFYNFLSAVAPGGTYVLVGGNTIEFFRAMFLSAFVDLFQPKVNRRKVKCLESKANQADLTMLKALIEEGKIKPFVDRTYSLEEVPTAIRYLEQRHVQGKIAISIGSSGSVN